MKAPDQQSPHKEAWLVMKIHRADAMTAGGFPVKFPAEGPHGIVPVFDSREQAVAWAGSAKDVRQALFVTPEETE